MVRGCLLQEKSQVEGVVEQQASEIHTLRTYEQQVSHMSHALSKMEGALRQEQEEKVRVPIPFPISSLCVGVGVFCRKL